ncbi:hypothetical protein MXB_362, partial [Myxobolus squamalis]
MSDTGSGKSTKIPQFCMALIKEKERIICTQPRRIAAISLAKRVAGELNTAPGEVVGYMVRFDNKFTQSSRLIYATDGSLLRESISDPMLLRYSIIILDEAHERSLHTDILFGVVKKAQSQRKSENRSALKIVIMSATICAEKFTKYFSAQIFYIEGRNFPIKHFYLNEPISDYFNAAYRAIGKLHGNQPVEYDILVFLAGQEEIESLKYMLEDEFNDMIIFGLFSAMPIQSQLSIFKKTYNVRRVILSTNIAETSITIPGVKIVIDSGVAKVKSFDASSGLVSLKVNPISRAEARQRSGRVGRTESGFCYRLYTENMYFKEFLEDPIPELLRSNLSLVLLMLLASGVKNPLEFDWIDPPNLQNIGASWSELVSLDAVSFTDSSYSLTTFGSKMALLPLEPRFSKSILLAASTFNCSVEMVSLISILTEKHILLTPRKENKKVIENNRKKFVSEYGDILMLLNVYNSYILVRKSCCDKTSDERQCISDNWCQEHAVNSRALCNVQKIRKQLFAKMKALDLPVISAQSTYHNTVQETESIICCLLSGFFDYTAQYSSRDRSYRTLLHNELVSIHPSSILHGAKNQFVFFTEKIYTTGNYIRNVSVFHNEWMKSISVNSKIKEQILTRLKNSQ